MAFKKIRLGGPQVTIHDPVVITDSRTKVNEHALTIKHFGFLWSTAFLEHQRGRDAGLSLQFPNVAAKGTHGHAFLVLQVGDRTVLPGITHCNGFLYFLGSDQCVASPLYARLGWVEFLIETRQGEAFDFPLSILGHEILIEIDQSTVSQESDHAWPRFTPYQTLCTVNLCPGGEGQPLTDRFFERRMDFIGQTAVSGDYGCGVWKGFFQEGNGFAHFGPRAPRPVPDLAEGGELHG